MKKKLYLIVALCLLLPAIAFAHHFKGLPHFNYFENYPQVPTEEYLAQEGKYEFSLVVYDFQGIKKEDTLMPDDVRLYVVIFDMLKNSTYKGQVKLGIYDGDTELYSEDHASSVEESIYTIQYRMPKEGDFNLRVSIPGEDTVGRVDFELSTQKKSWGVWLGAILFFLVFIAGLGSRQARLRQDRSESLAALNEQQKKETKS